MKLEGTLKEIQKAVADVQFRFVRLIKGLFVPQLSLERTLKFDNEVIFHLGKLSARGHFDFDTYTQNEIAAGRSAAVAGKIVESFRISRHESVEIQAAIAEAVHQLTPKEVEHLFAQRTVSSKS